MPEVPRAKQSLKISLVTTLSSDCSYVHGCLHTASRWSYATRHESATKTNMTMLDLAGTSSLYLTAFSSVYLSLAIPLALHTSSRYLSACLLSLSVAGCPPRFTSPRYLSVLPLSLPSSRTLPSFVASYPPRLPPSPPPPALPSPLRSAHEKRKHAANKGAKRQG